MINWFHKLLNPHCAHCKADEEDSRICNNCEYLKMIIAQLQRENEKLVNNLIPKPASIMEQGTDIPIALPTSTHIPWKVKRQQLEAADRARAEQLRTNLVQNHETNIESLEKEILKAEVTPVELTGTEDAK